MAATLASLLLASLLAVVSGAPVQAANTAHEVLVDHDSNASTAMVREFAGQDRYDTAMRLARNYATSKGGLGTVSMVYLSSGESLVDSISAAGLAGYTDAPILLTRSDALSREVANYIEDYGVGVVTVLGGPAAISDDVLDALMALDNTPSVSRVAGDDRYATAAAAASMIESDSTWCGSTAKSAVLINGSAEALGFGVAVQAAAYRMHVPVLMTAANELPAATADFISDNNIEHVQIIGGDIVVSDAVESALTTLGVDTVARTDGDTAADVSVALAMAAGDGCSDALAPVANDRVVLVRGNPDGVASAPVLSSTLANGEFVTPLIVDDTLPEAVRDYLASTPTVIDGMKQHLGIVAIGGTAAVSAATMADAIEAATSSDALTVQIGATTDTNEDGAINADDPVRPGLTFSLYFSDDVDDAELLSKVQDIIEINGAPAAVANATRGTSAGACTPRRVDVTLRAGTVDLPGDLIAGDTISVVASELKFGTGMDQRNLMPGSPEVVSTRAPDRIRPTVQIFGIAGQSEFIIRVSDAGGLANDATVIADELTFAPASGTAGSLGNVTGNLAADGFVTVAVSRPLVAGDRLTLKASAIADAEGNVNGATSARAVAPRANPRIVSVLMSQPHHGGQAQWTAPGDIIADDADMITFTTKVTGDAAGAAGNDWTINFDRVSTHDATKDVAIDVFVDSKRKAVFVRFVNGVPTVAELIAALQADSDFDARFAAATGCGANVNAKLTVENVFRGGTPAVGVAATDDIGGLGGRTQFAIEVRFSDYIRRVGNLSLLQDVFNGVQARIDQPINSTVLSALGLGALIADTGLNDAPGAPTKMVRYAMTTNSLSSLPRQSDLVTTLAGNAPDPVAGNPPGVVPAVAEGYFADDLTTADVNESYNGASQVRIAVSANVAAR